MHPSLSPLPSAEKGQSQHFLPTTKAKQPPVTFLHRLTPAVSSYRLLLGAVHSIPYGSKHTTRYQLSSISSAQQQRTAFFAAVTTTAEDRQNVKDKRNCSVPPLTACTLDEGDSGMKGQHKQSNTKDLQLDSSVS